MPAPAPLHQEALILIHAIETELRRIGRWQDTPLAPEQQEITSAFGQGTISFYQWLQFILVPRVREIIANNGDFPASSSVAVHALRTLDGIPEAEPLVSLLADFDALFEPGRRPGPYANGKEHLAALQREGLAPNPAIMAVRGFLIGVQNGNPDAARTHLTRQFREDSTFAPEAPFQIYDFQCAAPETLEDCVVVKTTIAGTDSNGERAEQLMPFVLVEEDGESRIDLARSMGMQMTGDPTAGVEAVDAALQQAMDALTDGLGQAMNGLADAMSSAFSESDRAQRRAADQDFTDTMLPELERLLSQRLKPGVRLEVDLDSFAPVSGLHRQLHALLVYDLCGGLSMLREESRAALAAGLKKVIVRSSEKASERGIRCEHDRLLVVLRPDAEELRFQSQNICTLLELSLDTDLALRLSHARALFAAFEDQWRERHGLDLCFDADWSRFTTHGDSLANAWALHLLAEHGIVQFGAAFESLLAGSPDIREKLAEQLRTIVLEPAETPEDQEVTRPFEDELRYRLFVAEGFNGHLDAGKLEQRILAALKED